MGVPQTRRGDRGRLKFSKQPLRITPRARRQVWELVPDAIERRYPTRELRALVAEIRRLNAIVECTGDLVRALERARLTPTPKLMLLALVERLETAATGRRKSG